MTGDGATTTATLSVAARDDLDDVAVLVNRAYRGDASRRGWTHEADLIDGPRVEPGSLADELDAPDPSMILVLRAGPGGPILACVMVQRYRDGAERPLCHLAMLTVDPEHQRNGLGARLIAEVERRARDMGCAAVDMTVVSRRAELIAFYGRRGYRPTGATKPFPSDDPRFGRPRRDDLGFIVLEKALI